MKNIFYRTDITLCVHSNSNENKGIPFKVNKNVPPSNLKRATSLLLATSRKKSRLFGRLFSLKCGAADHYLETSDSVGCDSVFTILAVCSAVRLAATHET